MTGSRPFPVVAAACACVAFALARPVAADGAEVRVAYEAPVECPTRARFLSLISARRPDIVVTEDAGELRRLVVVVRGERGAYGGELASFLGDRRMLVREVAAPSCEEVCDALAFIAAVAADSTPEALPPPARGRTVDEVARENPTAPEPTSPAHWSGATGAKAEMSGRGADNPLAGFRLSFQIERADPGALMPLFRLSIAQTLAATATKPEGSAHFRWTTARLEACPVRLSLGERLRARPCAGLEAGFVVASGDLRGEARHSTRPWFAALLAAHVAWTLAGPVSLELEGGAVVPLQRDDFFFQMNTVVYKVPAIEAAGGAGVSIRIW